MPTTNPNWCVSDEEAQKAAASYYPHDSVEATQATEIPPELQAAVNDLEEVIHDTWAFGRMTKGWTWGWARDDVNKQHPDLLPIECLSPEERSFDHNTAKSAIQALLAKGYTITPPKG